MKNKATRGFVVGQMTQRMMPSNNHIVNLAFDLASFLKTSNVFKIGSCYIN
ncbi:hypothetical protein RND71_027481 [Anisodus tanguticus]|uniref:Uncharacterized protein n=1 Tax=Anisodus tanguticus TaxID=243964 RepID=A0AAE1RJB7_9SOLA|nr:hypothetical protein RND71_027481 [Anisodus tanguticus]